MLFANCYLCGIPCLTDFNKGPAGQSICYECLQEVEQYADKCKAFDAQEERSAKERKYSNETV